MRERSLEANRLGDGLSRRDLLRVGTLAGLGVALPGSLRAPSPVWARASAPAVPPARDVACILIWLQGGLSPLDSFDPKPEAPAEVRGAFGVIDTRVPGIRICDQLPRLAQVQDRYAILRALNPGNGVHGVSEAVMMSGHRFRAGVTYPTWGAVVARELGGRDGLPPFVQIGTWLDTRFGGGTAGFLGEAYAPVVLPSTLDRTARDAWRARFPTPGARLALDLDGEAPGLRDRYGRNSLGQGCLLARRLIEAGTRFVTVTDGGWDTHQNTFVALGHRLLPQLDAAVATLLQDLCERGRLDTTLVLVLSDFGRASRVNASAGRDHNPTAGVALLAGAGIRPGQAVGATDALGSEPIATAVAPEDLAATVFNRLGLPLDTRSTTREGRSIPISPPGRVIRELL